MTQLYHTQTHQVTYYFAGKLEKAARLTRDIIRVRQVVWHGPGRPRRGPARPGARVERLRAGVNFRSLGTLSSPGSSPRVAVRTESEPEDDPWDGPAVSE
eukprot:764140-Hanusia_phi.AAC.4